LVRVEVPEDLLAFLSAGRPLQYDAGACEAGKVRLHRPDDLRQVVFRAQTYGTPVARLDPNSGEAGTYAVPGVDLVADCEGDYEPEGLLVWFPLEQRYGTTTQRGVDRLVFANTMRDLLPYGRQEEWEDSPPGYPQRPTWWVQDLPHPYDDTDACNPE
jgi:hypothetical protein